MNGFKERTIRTGIGGWRSDANGSTMTETTPGTGLRRCCGLKRGIASTRPMRTPGVAAAICR